jgi:hypothetical protein
MKVTLFSIGWRGPMVVTLIFIGWRGPTEIVTLSHPASACAPPQTLTYLQPPPPQATASGYHCRGPPPPRTPRAAIGTHLL